MTDPAPQSAPDPRALRRTQREEEDEPFYKSTLAQVLGVLAVIVVLIVVIAKVDLRPSLDHLEANLLTGSQHGHYHAVAERMVTAAKRRSGTLINVPTQGSTENVTRLLGQTDSGKAHFALVQDGLLEWGDEHKQNLELVARLTTSETVFLLGRQADAIQRLADLAGKRIGIGPQGSGTARLARQVFATRGLKELKVELVHHTIDEQLNLAEQGKLDLAVLVMEKDARLVDEAVRARGLQITGLPHAASVAHRLSMVRSEVLPAGHYDPVKVLPPTDKPVLVVDTLVLGNRTASRSEIMGFLTLLRETFPGFVRHNKTRPNDTGLAMAKDALEFFQHGGPGILDEYAPRLVDYAPLSNLLTIGMAISVLFNLLGVANRFFLWRVDVRRVELEAILSDIFGPNTTVTEIAQLEPSQRQIGLIERLRTAIAGFEKLRQRCRRLSCSPLVPMGGELSYRFQEELIAERLTALHAFEDRIDDALAAAS